jgi:hypothetical protein
MKICNHCKLEKPLDAFSNLRRSKDGHATRCKKCQRKFQQDSYYRDIEKTRERQRNKNHKLYWNDPKESAKKARCSRRRLRLDTLEIYGGKCACCGEREESFLTIDHIHGDGNKHRREVGNNSISVLQAIRREGYPKDKYQVLCFNCNRSKFALGYCAHQIPNTKNYECGFE